MGPSAFRNFAMLAAILITGLSACAHPRSDLSGARQPSSTDPKIYGDIPVEQLDYSIYGADETDPDAAWGLTHFYELQKDLNGSGLYLIAQKPPLTHPGSKSSETILDLDDRSLELMVRMGRLTREQKDLYFNAGKELAEKEPDRVVLFRAVRPGTDPSSPDLVSAVKLIRGFSRPLPWAIDFPELAKRNIRNGEYSFELSRCVNAGGEQAFRTQLMLAVISAAQSVISEGGNLSNSYVYAHTIVDQTADKVFRKSFSFKRLKGELPPGHAVLRRSLRDFLRELKPENHFADLRAIREATGIKDSAKLLEFHFKLKGLQSYRMPIEAYYGDQHDYVELKANRNPLTLALMARLCRRYQVSLDVGDRLLFDGDKTKDISFYVKTPPEPVLIPGALERIRNLAASRYLQALSQALGKRATVRDARDLVRDLSVTTQEAYQDRMTRFTAEEFFRKNRASHPQQDKKEIRLGRFRYVRPFYGAPFLFMRPILRK